MIRRAMPSDHHREYLARAVAGLTPEGHRRVDELLEQLADVVGDHAWLVRFAKARELEADFGRTDLSTDIEPARMLTARERDELMTGFRTIRDQEPLDDVGDWANAVLALLEDEAGR
jgi:hypothetical protein